MRPRPTLWLYYAQPQGTQEVLWARPYDGSGHPRQGPLRLGVLHNVAQTEVATGGASGEQWVTLGDALLGIRGHRIVQRIAVPWHDDLLSIVFFQHQVVGVVQNPSTSHVHIAAYNHGHWRSLTNVLPLGITTLWPEGKRLWALVADPHSAWVDEVIGGSRAQHIANIEPEGTMAITGQIPIVPYADGQNGFGYWADGRHPFSSVYHAVISVADTDPIWGLTVHGLVPYRHHHFSWSRQIPWPEWQATTSVVVGDGQPWIVILDGFSQGNWFDVRTGQFGGHFTIQTPTSAVVRAVSVEG